MQRLVDALALEWIYQFGSRAGGDVGSDSDYDVLVVVSRSDLPAHRRDQWA